MTYNPGDLVAVRSYLLSRLDLQPGVARGVDLEPGEVGIMGDSAHAAGGGYHVGNDDLARAGLLYSDYSKHESTRDRPGSNAASALDIGDFDATTGGRRITLRSMSVAIVAACHRRDPRTRDIREVIYSPDGVNVHRWDRLGVRSSGDDSHLWHTHLSFHRDSDGRRAADDNLLGLLKELIEGDDDMAGLTADERRLLEDTYYWARAAVTGRAPDGREVTDPLDGRPIAYQQIVAAVKAATAKPAAPVALSDADRDDIAARTAAKLGTQLAGLVADEVAKRLGNG